jgi:L-amino acid N-acyltransferase YncA
MLAPGRSAAPRAEVRLRDGERIAVRAARAADEPALRKFFAEMSEESRRFRFFSPAVDVADAARRAAAGTPECENLVALTQTGTIVGHAMVVGLGRETAEVALEVAENHRRLGLAGALLEQLVDDARARGTRSLVAYVLPDNGAVLALLHHRLAARERREDGVVRVDVELRPRSAIA